MALACTTLWGASVSAELPPQQPAFASEFVDALPYPSGSPGAEWRIPNPNATIAGTPLNGSAPDTTYLLYPNACLERAAGTWAPRGTPQADSLDTYAAGTTGPYTIEDLSLKERLWRIVDVGTDPGQRPPVINGARSIWCGKYDPNWIVKVGYPNLTYQILYIDTGVHDASYTFSMQVNMSMEKYYDYLFAIGGGGSAADPLGNTRSLFDEIVATGHGADSDLLVTWTGSIVTGGAIDVSGGPAQVIGSNSAEPVTVSVSLTSVRAAHRAIYILFASDCLVSQEDGLWPVGRGQVLDRIGTSDHGLIYDDQVQPQNPDPPYGPFTDFYGGEVLLGTAVAPILSARVIPGVGEIWSIAAGNEVPTPDICSPQKELPQDRVFLGADQISKLTIPGSWASIRTCTFPIPPGAAAVYARATMYIDLPRTPECAASYESRFYKDGTWSNWAEVRHGVTSGALSAWIETRGEVSGAAQADSIQLRYYLNCQSDASPTLFGAMFDNLGLEVISGVPTPVFAGAGLAQSTFVDGTMLGTNCSIAPCWPGVRGSDLPGGVDDNFNNPAADAIGVGWESALRRNNMGINWRHGFSLPVNGARTAFTNASYNPAYDTPRMIYRLFDPATKMWSPFDSTELDAFGVVVSGADTVVAHFEMDWPPREKLEAHASLPGGFTINGNSLYSQIRFLPRGVRLQYYFKGVDIGGGVTYRFDGGSAALEVEDLPTLPGGGPRAPDIIEFDVLPGVYPPGASGTLLAGRTDTPILNLDAAYRAWGSDPDPVTQALRALGVRADRYRLEAIILEGGNIGGHELPGEPPSSPVVYFPNSTEYGILDRLANQYRIIIQPSHLRRATSFREQDADLIRDWWNTDTGIDGGDRCIFGSGDDFFSALTKTGSGFPRSNVERLRLMNDVFGVGAVNEAWSGSSTNLYPTIDDRFAGGGPGLSAPNAFTYPVDGGCPGNKRFDGLTKVGSSEAQNSAIYPGGVQDVAGVARMSEKDVITDSDRSKALGYGFSIQFIRSAGIPATASNYVHSGIENRMRVLYKFLTSCRQGPTETAPCWPCPSNPAEMSSNWATGVGFQTGIYGPLYPVQDYSQATGVPEQGPGVSEFINTLSQNQPNPFNPETVIPYSLATAGHVTIRIFDVAGRVVRTLVDGWQAAGPHVARWNGRAERGGPLASGIYFYTVCYPDGKSSARKMTVLR